MLRVVVSGGGTGGHIMPALAVAESLCRLEPDAEILYIGGRTGMESEMVPRLGISYQPITIQKLYKVASVSTIGVALSFGKGYQEARTYLKAFRANAVVGTGGYVASAAILAAAHLGVPTFIHEGNAIAGRTNLMQARWTQRIGVTFAETVAQFPARKTVVTGMPLRAGIILPETVTPAEARQAFEGLEPDRFTVLITGGSQGARRLNQITTAAVPALLEAGIQVLHLTGKNNVEDVAAQAQELGIAERAGYVRRAFCNEHEMPLAWRAAHTVVCRGGVSTLAESWANLLPSVIVPLPTAYADHQTANARVVEKSGAGFLRPEADLTPETLCADIIRLCEEATLYEQMKSSAKALARPDAAEVVAREVLNLAER